LLPPIVSQTLDLRLIWKTVSMSCRPWPSATLRPSLGLVGARFGESV